jgi:SlyX protein
MSKPTDQRLTDIEIHLADVIRVNDDLSLIVAKQQKELDRLGKLVQLLVEREAEREADGGEFVADQRPPHW